MDTTGVDLNPNYKREMEDEFDDSTDDKVYVEETVISGEFINEELYKQRGIHNYVTIKDKSIGGRTVVGFINENPCDTQYRQGSILNYVGIKDEDIDYPTIAIPETELTTDCTDYKVCPNETVISRGDIKQELCSIKDEQGSVNINDLIAEAEETKLMIDCVDNKVCVYETIISGGYVKEEPRDMENESESIHNNVNLKGCEECGEEYDLYCLKCPMLIRIFDSKNPDGRADTVRRTLPKNFIGIRGTPSCADVVALRTIPKGVVFGPFRGLHSIKDDTVSKWKLKNTKNPGWLNWMQYIRKADKSSHKNLVPFQYEEGLYYRSECQINAGDELLMHWDNDSKESEIQDMEDGYWKPQACEKLADTYGCTFCCVGYKSISHLDAHNSTCIEKRNRKDFCEEIVQCDICKIYLDKKEYSDYHIDHCYKSKEKCASNPLYRIDNGEKPFRCTLCLHIATTKWKLKRHIAIHNDDRPFTCTVCSYRGKTSFNLKRHIANHNGNKPFACILCPYKARTKPDLKKHIAIHNAHKPFACTLCSYKTMRKSDLERHIRIHNGDTPSFCPLCPYKTMTKPDLKQHITMHNVDKPFACTLCPYKAWRKGNLKSHIASHIGNKPFACALCPYKARRKENLRSHIANHSGNKPFGCPFCSHKTRRKEDLKEHIAIHNGNKPFACTICPYKAGRKRDLKRHVAIHIGDKPFACTLCPYKAKRKADLKRHDAIHNGNKPFACHLCSYKATKSSNLKQHIGTHSDDKPFACTFCSYKARTIILLKRHLVRHNE